MTNMKTFGAVVVAVAIIAFFAGRMLAPSQSLFGQTQQLIEQYDPYVRYSGGIRSALPIITTGAVTFSGGQTISGNLTNTGTWTQGTSGTAINRINQGACDVLAYATTISASTTGQVDCSATGGFSTLTGVTSGDNVFAHATTTISCTTQGCVNLVASNASTTAGYITLTFYNATGGTFTWTGTASTSIKYFVIH